MSDVLDEEDAVVSQIEERLLARNCRLAGSSDSCFWESPRAFWRDDAYRNTWYSHAKRYWEDAVRLYLSSDRCCVSSGAVFVVKRTSS